MKRMEDRTNWLLLPTFTFLLIPSFATSQTVSPAADTIPLVSINAAGDSFMMGDGEHGPNVTETISYTFSMSKYLITNSQFALFIFDGGYATKSYWTTKSWAWKGNLAQPAYWTDCSFNGPSQPVVGVSWYEAVAYCNWLSVKEGLVPAYDGSGRANLSASGYRLPTEVEWEYAAAKGAPGQAERTYPWGNTWDSKKAVCRVSPASASKTADVGSKSPEGDTPQGLSDMSGNVWQWCSDNAQSDASVAGSPPLDRHYFQSDSTRSYFVLCGGSWYVYFEPGCRSAFRKFHCVPGARHHVIGFRVVRR